MKIEIIDFDEDKFVAVLEVDEQAKQMLLEEGFNSILKKYLEEFIKKNEQEIVL